MFGDQCVEDGSAMFKNVLHLIRKSFFSRKISKKFTFPFKTSFGKEKGYI